MDSSQQRIRSLMQKYLQNKCTYQELEELFAFIEKHPHDPLLGEVIDLDAKVQQVTDEKLPEEITHSMMLSLQRKLEAQHTGPLRVQWRSGLSNAYFRIAAVLLAIMVCTGVLYYSLKPQGITEIRTAYGEIKEVMLPDNSMVILNGNSVLRFNANWSAEKIREVHLTGEAFFNVTHQLNHQKFWVHSSDAVTIEVLGTEFNVNNRRSRTQVVLHSGKIRLDIQGKDKARQDILMNSGEYVEVKQKEATVTHTTVDSHAYIAWKNRKLIFKETSLREIVYLLEDNYGIEAVINDPSILDETFTASYPADEINVLLKALTKSFKIKIENTATTPTRIIIGDAMGD